MIKQIQSVVINGVTYPYLGPKPGFAIGVLLYDDNGETKEIALSKLDGVTQA